MIKSFIILGTIDSASFSLFYAWGIIGLVINLLLDIAKRKPGSINSPREFKLRYYWKDNWFRLLSSNMLLPISLLLYSSIMGEELNYFNAFLMGYFSDSIVEFLKRKNFLN